MLYKGRSVKIKIKQRNGAADFWLMLVWAFLAIAVGGILLFITKERAFGADKSISYLASCKNQEGNCKTQCGVDETSFYKAGCPFDLDGDGILSAAEKGEYCCIPKSVEKKK